MKRTDAHALKQVEWTMLAAIRAGRHWSNGTTSVTLGAVISKGLETYAVQRGVRVGVRVGGMLVATIGRSMHIRVMEPTDRIALSRINALLQEFCNKRYTVWRSKHNHIYVTHKKVNTISHKLGMGTTQIPVGEWWEVPGPTNLDCTIIHRG